MSAPAKEEKPAAAGGHGAPAKGGGKKKLILILVIGLVLGGGGLGGYMFLAKGKSHEVTAEEGKEGGGKEGKDGPKDKGKGKLVMLKPITAALTKSHGTRYLRVTIGMETSNEEVAKELDTISVQLADMLIEKLGDVRIEDIDNASGKNKLKTDIILATNELLESGVITKVYFNEFFIQ